MKHLKQISMTLLVGAMALTSCQKKAPSGIEHVIVIGLDGMSTQGMLEANTPCMDSLMLNGAYNYETRCVYPSSSTPNWYAMMNGAGPEATGVGPGDWQGGIDFFPPVATTENRFFPNIFRLIREQMPQAETGAIYDWSGFEVLLETQVINEYKTYKDQHETAVKSAEYIVAKKPTFLFIQLDEIDHHGHGEGHMSPAYIKGIEKADEEVRTIVNAVHEAGIADRTLILVVSDHGGVFYRHGETRYEEMVTPIIYSGAGVKKNYRIKQQIYRYDLAADVAFALGLKQPQLWTGRPVKPAFEGFDEPDAIYAGTQILPTPLFMTKNVNTYYGEVLYDEDAEVVIRKPMGYEGEIYYTIDGTEPTVKSTKYTGPFKLTESAIVQAKMIGTNAESATATGDYRVCRSALGHGLRYAFYHLPGQKGLPSFTGKTPVSTGICHELDTNEGSFKDFEALQSQYPTDRGFTMDGYLEIDEDGVYTFYGWGRGVYRFLLDGKLIFQQLQAYASPDAIGEIYLTRGRYPIHFELFKDQGDITMQIYYTNHYDHEGYPSLLVPGNKLYMQAK